MKTASAKQKGRLLQKHVRDLIFTTFRHLSGNDVVSTSMGAGGVDVKLSPEAVKVFPYAVECKNQESLSLWAAWKQCVENASQEALNPLLVVKRNKQEPLAILEFKHFMSLFKGINNEK